MHSWENDAVLFVGEPLNHIHQDTRSARLIAVCKRSLKARLHARFLLRFFSFWCMRLNGLTYECALITICATLYKPILLWLSHSIACVRMRKMATKIRLITIPLSSISKYFPHFTLIKDFNSTEPFCPDSIFLIQIFELDFKLNERLCIANSMHDKCFFCGDFFHSDACD